MFTARQEAALAKAELQAKVDACAAEAASAATVACRAAESETNALVAESYAMQRAIEVEIRAFREEAATCGARIAQLKSGLDDVQTALKELGDVSNWAALIESSAKETGELARQVVEAHTQIR